MKPIHSIASLATLSAFVSSQQASAVIQTVDFGNIPITFGMTIDINEDSTPDFSLDGFFGNPSDWDSVVFGKYLAACVIMLPLQRFLILKETANKLHFFDMCFCRFLCHDW